MRARFAGVFDRLRGQGSQMHANKVGRTPRVKGLGLGVVLRGQGIANVIELACQRMSAAVM